VTDNGAAAGTDRLYNGMPAAELGDLIPTLEWRKATGAEDAGVEMARLPDGQVAVRNSAYPDGPALIYTRAEIEALIGGAQDGDFDALLA
jgi:Domain of unknown function (DUF397)